MYRAFHIVQMILVVFVTLVSGLGGVIIMLITFTPKVAAEIFPNRFWSPAILFIFGMKIQIHGRKELKKQPPSIYVANHSSPLDIPIMFMSTPVPGYFVAKKELKKIPVFGWYMQLAGMIFIDRGNREKAIQSMRKAGERIKKGFSVIAFPEGTRSRDGKVHLFKRGSFMLSQETGIPIVPVGISGAYACMPANSIHGKPGVISVTLGTPILPEEFKGERSEDFANSVQEKVIHLMDQSTPIA